MDRELKKIFWIFVCIVATVAVIRIAAAIIIGYDFGGSFQGFPFDPFFGFGIMFILGGIVSVVLVILVLYFIFKVLFENDNNIFPSNSYKAEQILKERLARGEISEDEYNNLMRKIRN